MSVFFKKVIAAHLQGVAGGERVERCLQKWGGGYNPR